MTVPESHDEQESLLGITDLLNEMTYVFKKSLILHAPNSFLSFRSPPSFRDGDSGQEDLTGNSYETCL